MSSKSPRPQSAVAEFSMEDFAKALEQHDYQFQKGQTIRGKVYSHEPDGVYVDIGAKSLAFLPRQETALSATADLTQLLPLQEEREFLIVREQNADGQVMLSLRQLALKQAWDTLLALQASNQTITVRVTGTNKGGLIVDAQGLRGFIPRSHLSLRDELETFVGQSLTVTFLTVDPEAKKLVLSERLASRSANISRLAIGQLVEGTIVSIKPYGLFVDIGGTTALLHIKQISQTYIASLPVLFEIGQTIKAVIVDLDEWKGRVSLSTRVLEKHPGELLESLATVMAEAEDRAQKLGMAAIGAGE
ncbi:S1 RNA-binding domain-containing protein [Trichothermofontia sichuanensis B231]|uniref:S1 RNA-binding domain-containing protein n=1 Tax=Trichothermofontia sichuanensis TaxID=3045816 RepID=UPI0022479AED|nr:S1 RNA-binding domain-containing protein [Trichothermofontia sichuanensis]UZQ53646.1 S1 RNA-binding domain-containing protein [Trichothermofontia sichuanensis B231]